MPFDKGMVMVSPIEKQVLQSQILDRIQQVQQQHSEMQQQYFNIQLSEERRKLKKKVNKSEEVFNAKVDEDHWTRQDKKDQQEQDGGEPGTEGKASGDLKQPDHIDIKV